MNDIINVIMKESKKAYKKKEVPVGCVIVENGKIISKAHNLKQSSHKCVNHAEILAISKASKKKKDWRLDTCELFVTLEPCSMCMEVIKQSRIKAVHYLLKSKFNNEEKRKITLEELNCEEEVRNSYAKILSVFFADKR